MEKYLLSLLAIMFALGINAQKDETIFGNNGIRFTGIWGGSTTLVNGQEDNFNFYEGGYFTFELNKIVLIGWSHHDFNSIINDGAKISFKTHDFILGYSPTSYRSLHPYLYTTVGRGTADLENEGKDRILSIQPSASIELNVLRWFRISAEGGYRFISGTDFNSISDQNLSGPFVGLRLKFGWSWGR